MGKIIRFYLLVLAILTITGLAWAVEENSAEDLKVIEANTQQPKQLASTEPMPASNYQDPLRYILGPDDVVQIEIMRHPEFSGTYPINLEGKIQYKFIGDIEVEGLTKKEMEEKIKSIIANFVNSPEVTVTILEYKSKVIYVLGEVGHPGKYYMRSETIPVREAVVQAGMLLQSAAMRKCRIITPSKDGRVKIKPVNLYEVLYGGQLKYNYGMQPGDVLYVPATVMAKLIRIINPVTSAVGVAASAPSEVSTARSAASALAK